MNQSKGNGQRMTSKERIKITVVTGLFAAIGAFLGIIAYHQHWLG